MTRIVEVPADYVMQRPEFELLAEQYTEEAGVKLWGVSSVREQYYKGLRALAVFEGDVLVGFACVRTSEHPHYAGKVMAALDAVFVQKNNRRGRIGIELINEAKALAKRLGADTLVMSAPYGSRLSRLLRFILRGEPVSEIFCVKTDTQLEEKHNGT